MTTHQQAPVKQFIPGRPSVAVLESNVRVLNYFRRTFAADYDLSLFSERDPFLKHLETRPKPALILLAWDGIGLSLPAFTQLRLICPTAPVIVLSCTSEHADYEAFARLGASSVVLKPFLDDNLQCALAKHLPPASAIAKPDIQEIDLGEGRSFVRSSRRMREIESQARLVARSDIPVLILGESGTGKEVIALFLHRMSRRSNRMFLKINCAAMPAELLESELFGYEQGAFTGAVKMKPGKFETCNGGTIFLDEIGEMPAILQAKLLQVLQDGTYSRLGSRSAMHTDVRVVAATNINMKKAMAEKTFREDLYYRLNGLSLVLPPLRERIEEIPAMAAYFMRKGAAKYELEPFPLTTALLDGLCRHTWPGNLRELENVINRLLVLRDESAILADLNPPRQPAADEPDRGLKHIVRGLKGEAEAIHIAAALEESGWNRKTAADALQISYKALLYKIKQYDLTQGKNVPHSASPDKPDWVGHA